MDPQIVLKGAVPPIAAALLLVSLGGARLLAAAAAIGLYVAFGLLKEWPAWPHELWHDPDGRQWLVWAVAACCFVATLERCRALPVQAGAVLGAATGAFGVWLVVQKVVARMETGSALLHVGGAALVLVLVQLASRRALARAPATVAPAIVWTVVLSIGAGIVALSGTALLGQLCGAVAAAVGAGAGAGLWKRPFALAPADATWLAGGLVLFLVAGVQLADLPLEAALCAAAAPAAVALLPATLARHPVRWTICALLLAFVPLALAGWLAFTADAARNSGY
jgi:hypothetical protein